MSKHHAPILAAGDVLDSIHAVIGGVSIQAADGEARKQPTFTANAYNGGPVRVAKYDLPVVVDLAGLEFAEHIRANLDHDPLQRVGHVVKPENDGQKLTLSGVISAAGRAAKEVIESIGYPWTASIEALPTTRPERIDAGQSVAVNGQLFTGPIYVARKSKLYGVAFLSNGADRTTNVTIAAKAAEPLQETEMEFNEWIKAAGFEIDTLNDKQKAHLQTQYDAEIKAAGGGGGKNDPPAIIPDNKFDLDGLKATYAQHESVIEAKLFEFSGKVEAHELAKIKAAHAKKAIELKSDALQKEWSPLQFEVEAIKAAGELQVALIQAERPTGPAIHASSKDASNEVIEAAMCLNLGLDVEKDYKEETLEAAHRNFRRIGLQEVMIMAAQANGYQGRARISTDNLREVLGYALPPSPIHAANSTVSLPGILSNVANKELLAGFMEEDQDWREIAEIKPVNDFKTVTSYRMLDDMEYEKLGANGEIAHGKLGEEPFTRSADTYAKMFALTRKMIINDDMGAFDDLRTRLGRGASRKFRKLFWATFINNSSFFTAGRGNYFTGAATTLLTDGVGLQTGITTYRKLKSGDKKQVGRAGSLGAPSILLVPPELEFVAQKLYVSGNLSTQQDDNIHRNKYRPVTVNELSDSDYTGYSATAWYLFGSILNPVVVSFLNGVQNPTVESADADFNMLGVQFRGYHDFGVDLAEWLAGVKSKGAA